MNPLPVAPESARGGSLRARMDRLLLRFAARALLAIRRRRSAADPGPAPVRVTSEQAYLETNLDRLFGWFPRECPLCGTRGYFTAFGVPPRFDARCPECFSLERHRLLALWIAGHRERLAGRRVLHVAPEPGLSRLIAPLAASYMTGDAREGRADRVLDLTAIDLLDASVDVILCSHVLEHVDDVRALAEMRRVLTDDGLAILLTPVIDAWEHTYENPSIHEASQRWLHFGQGDHVRYYGRDVVTRIERAGFDVSRFVAGEPDVARYALRRGETIFLAVPRGSGGDAVVGMTPHSPL